MRSRLTEVIRRVEGMISYVRENLSGDEYNLFLDLLVPEPEAEQPKVKRRRKSKTVSATPPKKKGLPAVNSEGPCSVENCGETADNAIHDPKGGYAGYHEFQPVKKLKAVAAGD